MSLALNVLILVSILKSTNLRERATSKQKTSILDDR